MNRALASSGWKSVIGFPVAVWRLLSRITSVSREVSTALSSW
ncbi:MAG TPA: hypothetical protein VNT50_03595 [Microbacterium sp.]|nr:hypothetical protein [Microbacterium sp.]